MSSLKLLVIAEPGGRYLSLLPKLGDKVQYEVTKDPARVEELAADADVILTGMGAPTPTVNAAIGKAQKLRWLHSLSAGVDHLMATSLRESHIPVTNAKGAYSQSLGEYCIAAMLFFAKDLRRMLNSQKAGKWDVFDIDMLQGKTLGILGYGDIGKASARRAKAFGMKVIALRRRPEKSAGDECADEIWGMDRKQELMAVSDYLLLAMPATPDTKGIVSTEELKAMKSDAVIINLGRGNAIDERALITALQEKSIRGAALDVFEVEPLPEGHVFYSLDNILVSFHTADHSRTWLEDSMEIFLANFDRFVKGEALQNLVDKSVGY
ncbi:D-2-hydroxyacid dehydrogenase [Bryobacter aggregatus]|uniref:D-2-hydroxyacid dehydrogenase n=1 Tax=Bryobacter aggregatus TaxID=360054 RepID=UPI0004E18364|nr:D-2-hydroxyacid dehydrogenase [Bryobacter aggregatus]